MAMDLSSVSLFFFFSLICSLVTQLKMLYLGMDISKDTIVCYADTVQKHYTITNTEAAVTTFLNKEHYTIQTTIIGCESTGDYHIAACVAALRLGYQVKLLNPIVTGKRINATIRKTKTDFTDAQLIATLTKEEHGTMITEEHFTRRTRTLFRTEQRLVRCMAQLKLLRKSLNLKAQKMDLCIAQLAVDRCIMVLDEESKRLTQEGMSTYDRQAELLDSIPGFGQKLAVLISAEMGDIKRFQSATQLKAYVGIDPVVKQSGTSKHMGKMSKRGFSLLRCGLYLAANVARQHDPVLKTFYDKKRAEGKSHRHVLCIIIRKLCERIYAVVTKDCVYQINYSGR